MRITNGRYWCGHSSIAVVHAQGAGTVPKAYGKFVGTMDGMLIFEDDNQILRFVTLPGGQIQELVVRNEESGRFHAARGGTP